MLVLVGGAAPAVAAPRIHTNLNEVRACYPLDAGDFLVGTGGGLVRMDKRGHVRKVWTAIDGLPATRIDGISMVGDQMWIGTELGAARVTIEATTLTVTRTAENKAVRDVVKFDGALYAATWGGGVKKLGANGSTEIAFKGGNNPAARSRVAALAIADGALWAGTANGLYKMRNGRFELTTIEAGANEVMSLYGDGKTLWIATTNGLYTREGATVRGYGGGDLRRVTKVDGQIVAAGMGGGVVSVDRGRLAALPKLPETFTMAQAITERDGAACAGGFSALYVRASKDAAWTAVKPVASVPANDVSAIAADGTKLWVGTFDHGVAVYDNNAWKRIESTKIDRRVNALLVEPRANKSSRVWVATATGISIIDGDHVSQLTKREGLPSRGVLSLARMRDGRILAGTMHGAAIIGEGRPIAIGLKQNLEASNVWAVAEDAAGLLWLGTTTGVFRGRADDNEWTRYSVATGHLRDDWVMALAPHGDAMFVGTYKGGVTRFDGTDTIASAHLGDGWINPGGLAWYGDRLYASTMEGLRIGDRTHAAWTSGGSLTARDTTATAMIGTTLWVSTRRGLVAR